MECQDTGAQCNNGKDRVRKNAKCNMQNAKGNWTMKNGKVRRRKGPTTTTSKQQH